MCGECPTPGMTTSRYDPPEETYASSRDRVCASIGCGGATSAPGYPGSTPSAPSWARSSIELSETIVSSSPRTQSTGGCGSTSANADRSRCLGAIAFSTPRAPGAIPGQVLDSTQSPG